MKTVLVSVVVLIFLVAVAAVAADSPAPVILPDSPAGNALSAFLDVYNSGDSLQWQAFLEKNYSPEDSAGSIERRMGFFVNVHGDFPSLTPVKILNDEPYVVTLVTKGDDGSGMPTFLEMSYMVDSLPPYRWARLSLRPTDDPGEKLPEGELTGAKLTAWLDEYLDEQVAADRFSGTVLIAKDGQPLYTRAVGMACKRYDVPNKLDTKFNLGSMNKMFTGVAIAQLVQEGRISFDDPISKYLPDYPNQDDARKIKIRHLLTHTSGMGDYWGPLFDTSFWEIKTVPQLAHLFWNQPLEFEPGDHFSYSNGGPVILGLVIEAVSGMSYYDYVAEHIYKPAGMINSGCFEVDTPVKNQAIGYTHLNYDGSVDRDIWHNNYFMHAVKGGPAGGGFSTVEDLLAFDQALRNHRLLNAAYTDTVITGKVDMGPEMKYAFLFGDENTNGHRIVGHNGGAPGINAQLDMYWDDGWTVAVMSNYDQAATRLAEKIKRVLTR